MLPGQSPLRQFQGNGLPEDALARLEGSGFASAEQLRDLRDGREAGQLARNSKAGPRVVALARHLPLLRVEVQVQPITRTILRLALQLRADFQWTDRYHGGGGEPFWVSGYTAACHLDVFHLHALACMLSLCLSNVLLLWDV